MAITATIPGVIQQKLAAFGRLQPEFEASFQFVQDVHGQKRFPSFLIVDVVHYLYARWICECKGRLLSVPRTVKEYEGKRCLELLWLWQEEENTAAVVAFLQYKLDQMPFAALTYQLHEAKGTNPDQQMIQRLTHGRQILLNRGINLMQALDAIFALPEEDLFKAVRQACERYGLLPRQLQAQIELLDAPLYSYVPNQALAQRNMLVMNKLGINVIHRPADLPGQRSWRIVEPSEPFSPFAEHLLVGYMELNAPLHNNLRGVRFVDRSEYDEVGEISSQVK